MDFKTSTLGKLLSNQGLLEDLIGGVDSQDNETSEECRVLSGEVLSISVMRVRALVGRLGFISEGHQGGLASSGLDQSLAALLDLDILSEVEHDLNPGLAEEREYKAIASELKALFEQPGVFRAYHEMYSYIAKQKQNAEVLLQAYESGSLNGRSLSRTEKTAIARHVIRTLNEFSVSIDEEIQNIHNQVSAKKRDYLETDRAVLEKLHQWKDEISGKMNLLIAKDPEVAIQVHLDHLKENSKILKRIKQEGGRGKLRVVGGNYIETDSRQEMIYGVEGPENYILGCLRHRQHVELVGPTGTGKTHIAVYAAKVFSGKDPIVVSGGPGVYKSTFFGAPKGLDTRTPGAVIQCLSEDRVLIIDEDNRIDPRQMAEIKYILGLKPGDRFTHPDTEDEYIIPAHFRIIVTRNEAGKHHKDRFDLPPEYRREFTHGSFEVDYYSPAEMYDEFLLPKLMNEDGSISLSEEEVGKGSPLHALVLAAEEIQGEYKHGKLKNAVFESGYLIGILDQWKEMQFRRKTVNGRKEPIRFLDYLETKLMEFVKRPIGNPNRKLIVQKLYNQGFFRGARHEDFSTANDGEIFTEAEFLAMTQGSSSVFKAPRSTEMTAREVALLDPFKRREIKIPPHPLEQEIREMSRVYSQFCQDNGMRPVLFNDHTLDKKRARILDQLVSFARKSGYRNIAAISAIAEKFKSCRLEEFLQKFGQLMRQLSPEQDRPSATGSTRGRIKSIWDGQRSEQLTFAEDEAKEELKMKFQTVFHINLVRYYAGTGDNSLKIDTIATDKILDKVFAKIGSDKFSNFYITWNCFEKTLEVNDLRMTNNMQADASIIDFFERVARTIGCKTLRVLRIDGFEEEFWRRRSGCELNSGEGSVTIAL